MKREVSEKGMVEGKLEVRRQREEEEGNIRVGIVLGGE